MTTDKFVALVLLLAAGSARAELPSIRFDRMMPLGAAAGSSVEVEIAGRDTDDVTRLLFDHPGQYRLERNMTVSRAISAGGGLTARGSERRVVVKRRDANGSEQLISVQGSDLLQADDVLLVKEGFF